MSIEDIKPLAILSDSENNKIIDFVSGWEKLALPEKVDKLSNFTLFSEITEKYVSNQEFVDLVTNYQNLVKSTYQLWDEEQQKICDHHIVAYTYKDKNVGYVFAGHHFADKDKGKWIVCGKSGFVEDYKNIVDEYSKQKFMNKYVKVQKIPHTKVAEMDKKYDDKWIRMMDRKSKEDSGWKQICK